MVSHQGKPQLTEEYTTGMSPLYHASMWGIKNSQRSGLLTYRFCGNKTAIQGSRIDFQGDCQWTVMVEESRPLD